MPEATPKLSDAQIAAVARSAGFSGDALIKAVAIALGESGGRPNAHNGNRATGDDSYGLWQINMIGSLGPSRRRQFGLTSNSELYDPATNARAAYAISNSGRNFGPWTVYTSGRYLAYMPRARTAANNPDSSGAGSGNGSGVQQAGLTDVFSWPGEILDFFEFIADPKTWLRLGMLIAGAVLLLIGMALVTGQTDRLKMAAEFLPVGKAAKAAAVAKAA